jgi:hypothetical protein
MEEAGKLLLFVFLLDMPASVCHPSHILPLASPMQTFILGVYTQGESKEFMSYVSAGDPIVFFMKSFKLCVCVSCHQACSDWNTCGRLVHYSKWCARKILYVVIT